MVADVTMAHEDSNTDRVTQDMLAALTSGSADGSSGRGIGLGDFHHHHHHHHHHTSGGSSVALDMDDMVQATQASGTDASGFSYPAGTSSEEVAMLEALLRHTATSDAEAAAAMEAAVDESEMARANSHSMSIAERVMAVASAEASLRGSPEHHSGDEQGLVMEQRCFECNDTSSITGNKLMYCSHCQRSYHQLCADPMVDDVWAEAMADWLCRECIQKYSLQFDTDTATTPEGDLTTTAEHDQGGHEDHDHQHIGKSLGRPLEQAVSGIGINDAQKRSYLNTLPRSVLVRLVMACDEVHPDMPLFPASLRAQALAEGANGEYSVGLEEDWSGIDDLHQMTPIKQKSMDSILQSDITPHSVPNPMSCSAQRRTQGRRAPRSAAGDPLPSYEDLCVEAVIDMNKPEGCLPKRIFEWISSTYPVAPNFRPSCSQALQRAYRKGKLVKCGRSYKVSPSELEHIQSIMLQQDDQKDGIKSEGAHLTHDLGCDDGAHGSTTPAIIVAETNMEPNVDASMSTVEGDNLEVPSHMNDLAMADIKSHPIGGGDAADVTLEHTTHLSIVPTEADAGESAFLSIARTPTLDTAHTLDNGGFDDSGSPLTMSEPEIDPTTVLEQLEMLQNEATDADRAAIVAAVTAAEASLAAVAGDLDDIDVDGSPSDTLSVSATAADLLAMTTACEQHQASMLRVTDDPMDEDDEELDVGTEQDTGDPDATASARTALSRHQQHRDQREAKRARVDFTSADDGEQGIVANSAISPPFDNVKQQQGQEDTVNGTSALDDEVEITDADDILV